MQQIEPKKLERKYGYRNIAFLRDDKYRVWGWNANGDRCYEDVSYKPSFFVPDANGTPLGIKGEKLREVVCTDHWDFYKQTKGFRTVYDRISVEQKVLTDLFMDHHEEPSFTEKPLHTLFFDIETYSPGDFPTPDKAPDPIIAIALYSSLDDRGVVIGKGEYTGKGNFDYIQCADEKQLLLTFLQKLQRLKPDVLCGWNSDYFDIPYIVNRIKSVLGVDDALSPIRNERKGTVSKGFNKCRQIFSVEGLTLFDYMDLYLTHQSKQAMFYALDKAAKDELGVGKVKYDCKLHELADRDWNTFVEYNMRDVEILVQLEERLHYIELTRSLACIGLAPYIRGLGTVSVITGRVRVEALKDGKILRTQGPLEEDVKYEGGFVQVKQPGFHDHIISFDINSLYPNCITTLNMSPETKVGYMKEEGGYRWARSGKNDWKPFIAGQWELIVEGGKFAIGGANSEGIRTIFSQKEKGLFPKIVEKYYKLRTEYKEKRNELRAAGGDPKEIMFYDTHQYVYKIFLNRVYGYFASKYAHYRDLDIAATITATGRETLKQSNVFLENMLGDDCVIYNDTDSCYVTVKNKVGGLVFNSDKYKKMVWVAERSLNTSIDRWVRDYLHSLNPTIEFKLEAICDYGFFQSVKKRYILHKRFDEGIDVNEWKWVGVNLAKKHIPDEIKELLEEVVTTMITTQDYEKTNEVFSEVYWKICDLSFEGTTRTQNVNNLANYKLNNLDVVSLAKNKNGKPIPAGPATRSALYYNYLIKKLELGIEPIVPGEEVHWTYISPTNGYGLDVVGYKDDLPKDFRRMFKVDYKEVLKGMLTNELDEFRKVVKWKPFKPEMAAN